MRRSTALVKPLAAARGFSTSSEKIVAFVLFERLPVVIPKLDPAVYAFQEFSFRWKQQYRRKYPDEFLDMSKSRGKGDYHIEYVPAPRITEADKTNDRNSLQRVLDRRLYLGNSHGAPSGKAVNKSPFFSLGTSRMAFSTKRSKTSSLARTCLSRCMSNVPENTVYGGPTPQTTDRRVTLNQLKQKYKKGEPITVVTAYDYPSAVHVDMAGIDICLVGDSAAMVVHGYDTTLPITLDEMLVHCRAVARGAKRPLLVGDLPFGTYETSTNQAVDTAVKVLKEGGMDAIKLEGGSSARIAAAKAIVEAGIAVMGHVGLTPQAISVLGGFRPQGKNVSSAMKVVETAMALQEAGCFAVVLECVPAPLAAAVTSALQIPTIGIGAGPFCSGQVLVYHDLLGMFQHPHHAMVTPKFCKQYASVGDNINKALLEYKKEVNDGSFPGASHTPYKMNPNDVDGFLEELEKLGLDKAASAATTAAEKMNTAQQPDSDKSQK